MAIEQSTCGTRINMQQTFMTRDEANLGEGFFDSINWALETHCKIPDARVYNAAILYGNEDAPERIDFYTQDEPTIKDKPALIWREKR